MSNLNIANDPLVFRKKLPNIKKFLVFLKIKML